LVAVDEHLEEVDPLVLVSLCGVVSLRLEHWVEGVVGGEVGAGFTDRFELAVELGRPIAVPVSK
jgi:hypothetical protein